MFSHHKILQEKIETIRDSLRIESRQENRIGQYYFQGFYFKKKHFFKHGNEMDAILLTRHGRWRQSHYHYFYADQFSTAPIYVDWAHAKAKNKEGRNSLIFGHCRFFFTHPVSLKRKRLIVRTLHRLPNS